jgi:hypothetical protein
VAKSFSGASHIGVFEIHALALKNSLARPNVENGNWAAVNHYPP